MTDSTASFDGRHALMKALNEPPRITISFFSYGVILKKQIDGGVTEYPINPQQLASTLSAKTRFDTGILSPNTITVIKEGLKTTIAEYRPPQKTAIYLASVELPLVFPLPGLLMIRQTTDNESPNYRIYAVKDRPIGDDTKLYLAPLPNTSSSGVCWGSVKKVSGQALSGTSLTEDWTMYLGSTFTNHNLSGKSKAHKNNITDMYIALEKRKATRYPISDLVSHQETIGEVLEHL